MHHSIVQTSLDPPAPEQLERAFHVLPDLVGGDADSLARDAYGILVSGLSLEHATALQAALGSEGVRVEVVEERRLPALPPPRRLNRADCVARALVVHDQLGRQEDVAWPQVTLVAAGRVRLTQFRRVERDRIVIRRGPRGGAVPIPVVDVSHKEERNVRLLLEIFTDRSPYRYRVEAGDFRYNYLGSRMQIERARNYVTVVRDVLQHAEGAVLNRGAALLKRDPNSVLQYPTRHAFEEEIVWLSWRRARSGTGGGG